MSNYERRKQFVSDTLKSIIEVACIVNAIEEQLDSAVSDAKKAGGKLDYDQAEKVARELVDRLRKEYGDKVLKKYRDEYFPKKQEEPETE